MNIIIAGHGKVGSTLTRQLSSEGYNITLIDTNSRVLESSVERYDVMAVHGNCASMDVLQQAGIMDADLLIAATNADEVNLLCCTTAHGMNPKLHTIARIRNPEYTGQIYSLRNIFGLSMSINPEKQAAAEIERLLAASPMGQLMLYIQVTRGAAPRKHEFPVGAQPNLIMYTAPIHLPPKDKRATLYSIEDLRFQYCNIKTTNLMPNVFAAQKATSMGATEALLHRGSRVTEAAHSSILMLKDGALVVPPLDELILPGITRAILVRLCPSSAATAQKLVTPATVFVPYPSSSTNSLT